MRKIAVFGLLTLFLLPGCGKILDYGKTTVSGRVVDAITDAPIPNATVYLIEDDAQLMGVSGVKDLDSARTDANGNYALAFDAEQGKYYGIRGRADYKFFDYDYTKYTSITGGHKNTKKDVPLKPWGYVKIHLFNAYPYNEFDEINYNGFGGGQPPVYYGKDINTYIIHKVHGNEMTDIYWWVRKNGKENMFSDKFFVKEFETTLYEINY